MGVDATRGAATPSRSHLWASSSTYRAWCQAFYRRRCFKFVDQAVVGAVFVFPDDPEEVSDPRVQPFHGADDTFSSPEPELLTRVL